MIYLAADPHADLNFAPILDYIERAEEGDLLIILGDVGLYFEDTEQNRRFNDFFLSIKKNVAFIDGNHENFDYFKTLPAVKWQGGEAFELTPNIHLMKRGCVYDIEGKSFFAFGGCKSSDKWKDMGLWYREEEPTVEQIKFARESLAARNYKVDFVLTHKYERQEKGVYSPALFELNRFIDEKVCFKTWYTGHGHREFAYDQKHIMLYDRLTPLI